MRLVLAAILATLSLTPAHADGMVTFGTGAKGEWTRDCDRAEGTATCTTSGLFTGADGQSASKTRVRTTVPGLSETQITTTGPQGNTRTRTRIFTWSN